MLEGLACGSTGDDRVQRHRIGIVDTVAADDGGLHLAAPPAEDVPGEELGIDQRIGDADVGQTLGRRADDRSKRVVGHDFQRRVRATVTKPHP
ncbi:hypothetical protein MOX01_25580 [Microbacterium oxydans]|nr:hypothetical protein MOX01_25580 [Microbacterium oxydans]